MNPIEMVSLETEVANIIERADERHPDLAAALRIALASVQDLPGRRRRAEAKPYTQGIPRTDAEAHAYRHPSKPYNPRDEG